MSQKITFASRDNLVSKEIEVANKQHLEKLLDWLEETKASLPTITTSSLTFDTAQEVLEALVHLLLTIPLYEAKVDYDTINPNSSD